MHQTTCYDILYFSQWHINSSSKLIIAWPTTSSTSMILHKWMKYINSRHMYVYELNWRQANVKLPSLYVRKIQDNLTFPRQSLWVMWTIVAWVTLAPMCYIQYFHSNHNVNYLTIFQNIFLQNNTNERQYINCKCNGQLPSNTRSTALTVAMICPSLIMNRAGELNTLEN